MLNNIAEIENLEQFFKFIEWCSASEKNLIFRGVKKSSFTLLPSVGRFRKEGRNLSVSDEKLMLTLFRQKGYPFLKEHADEDLEVLSIAQHSGMPTRLLDWSKNPLVAAYFAVEHDFEENEAPCGSVIYVFQPKHKVNLNRRLDPFRIKTLTRFVPRHWSPRISAQAGQFTIHPQPNEPYESEDISTATIKVCVRRQVKLALNRLGIHRASLYPDLDGVAAYVKWLQTEGH
ncbi:FRG domain-containing protein [uncultured Paludibaculum sp.]|uniref:FRG domain-containing protein n=1 Tax=uncultured Paludibaculum sp. TaxID=1765020 RepID=UPI002AAB22E5|nr:FRG domain-containing protein [uncultured Paludibaculum sp.]